MGYQSKYEEYDWIETVKRQRIYLLISIPYLVIFVILSNVFGEFVGKTGLVIFAFLTVLAGIWIGPVRKLKNDNIFK